MKNEIEELKDEVESLKKANKAQEDKEVEREMKELRAVISDEPYQIVAATILCPKTGFHIIGFALLKRVARGGIGGSFCQTSSPYISEKQLGIFKTRQAAEDYWVEMQKDES